MYSNQVQTAACGKYWVYMDIKQWTIWILIPNSYHNLNTIGKKIWFNLSNKLKIICGRFILSQTDVEHKAHAARIKTDHRSLNLCHYLRASQQVQTLPLCSVSSSPAVHITMFNSTSWTGWRLCSWWAPCSPPPWRCGQHLPGPTPLPAGLRSSVLLVAEREPGD